jgi:arginine deiminase
MNFIQHCELCPAKLVLIHQPRNEVYLSMMHPAASLYSDVVHANDVHKCFQDMKEKLKENNCDLVTVKSILVQNREKLLKLAFDQLEYKLVDVKEAEMNHKKFQYYISDEYKLSVLNKLTNVELVEVLLTRPTYKIKYCDLNTNIEFQEVSFKPLSNLLFVRDQQITTKNGIVIGRSTTTIRSKEHEILKTVFENMGAKIIGEIPENGKLEGGDFYPLRGHLALLGIGIRTNIEAANYLMKNDLLGTEKFALIIDETDLNQKRMHLDTFFNILDRQNVVLMDFEEYSNKKGFNVNRRVELYVQSEKNEDDPQIGKYAISKKFETFEDFLKDEGYNIVKFTVEDQANYFPNFLNIGNGVILACNQNVAKYVADNKINVKVVDVNFEAVTKMYGALHCASQVFRDIHIINK